MRYLRRITMLLLPVLFLSLAVPSAAAAAKPADSPGAVHTDFEGLYFPAGMEGTGTDCPGTWMGPALCILDPEPYSSMELLPSGRLNSLSICRAKAVAASESAIRSCGRFGPEIDGSTVDMSRCRVSV